MLSKMLSKPFKSIRYHVLMILLGLTIAATLTLIAVAIYTTNTTGASAQRISSQALQTQAEGYLVQLTKSSINEYDSVLEGVLKETRNLAGYTAYVFDHAEDFTNEGFWLTEDHMHQGEQGQLINGPDDLSSVYVPATTSLDDQSRRDIRTSAYLDYLFASIYKNSNNIEAIYFASPRDVLRYYPNIDLGTILPADFQATGRVWYAGSVEQSASQRTPWWTPPYVDATGLGLVTTAAMPVYDKYGDLIGVVGLDITLNEMIAAIKQTSFMQTGYSFLVDKTGHAISLPDQGFEDIMGRPPQPGEFYSDISTTVTAFSPIIERMLSGEEGFESINVGDQQLYISYAPIKSTGWSLASVIEADDVLSSLAPLQTEFERRTRSLLLRVILPGSVLAIVFAILTGLLLTNRIVNPIQDLAAAVDKFRAGHHQITLDREYDDEIGLLAKSFNAMANQIHDLVNQLEGRVSERTRELERRNLQMRVAAEVVRDATAIQDLDELVIHAVELIRGRFGFYHTGLYLTDIKNEYIVLRAGTGNAGREMLNSGYKQRIHRTQQDYEATEPFGLVGIAVGNRQIRIVSNLDEEGFIYRNQMLPETHSEIALPLIVGDRVLGALDIQSQFPNAFGEDDITALQIISDQLAIAIQSAQLFAEVQESLLELQTIYSHYSREQWQDLKQSREIVGYQYNSQLVTPIHEKTNGGQHTEKNEPQPLQVPLEVRGQVIGELDIWPESASLRGYGLELIEDIATRLSQVMESARLFEQAQQQASREQMVGEITGHIRETLDINTILHTAAQEILQALRLRDVTIKLDGTLGGELNKRSISGENVG